MTTTASSYPYRGTDGYPDSHFALSKGDKGEPWFVAEVKSEIDGSSFMVKLNPSDARGYRTIVVLIHHGDMRSTLNRSYTLEETQGLMLVLGLVAKVFESLYAEGGHVVVPQIEVAGNNAHDWKDAKSLLSLSSSPAMTSSSTSSSSSSSSSVGSLGSSGSSSSSTTETTAERAVISGTLTLGNASEPVMLHGHIIIRGDPFSSPIKGVQLGGPKPGSLFNMRGNSKDPTDVGNTCKKAWSTEEMATVKRWLAESLLIHVAAARSPLLSVVRVGISSDEKSSRSSHTRTSSTTTTTTSTASSTVISSTTSSSSSSSSSTMSTISSSSSSSSSFLPLLGGVVINPVERFLQQGTVAFDTESSAYREFMNQGALALQVAMKPKGELILVVGTLNVETLGPSIRKAIDQGWAIAHLLKTPFPETFSFE